MTGEAEAGLPLNRVPRSCIGLRAGGRPWWSVRTHAARRGCRVARSCHPPGVNVLYRTALAPRIDSAVRVRA